MSSYRRAYQQCWYLGLIGEWLGRLGSYGWIHEQVAIVIVTFSASLQAVLQPSPSSIFLDARCKGHCQLRQGSMVYVLTEDLSNPKRILIDPDSGQEL